MSRCPLMTLPVLLLLYPCPRQTPLCILGCFRDDSERGKTILSGCRERLCAGWKVSVGLRTWLTGEREGERRIDVLLQLLWGQVIKIYTDEATFLWQLRKQSSTLHGCFVCSYKKLGGRFGCVTGLSTTARTVTVSFTGFRKGNKHEESIWTACVSFSCLVESWWECRNRREEELKSLITD